MQMRRITQLGVTVSRLGFGFMRLPEKNGKIDAPTAQAMVDYLHQNGVNYYDTALFYHNSESEAFVKSSLVDRYPRDSFTVATKLPIDRCRVPEDMTRIFEAQREKIGVSCIDFYLLHGIGTDDWAKAKRLGAPDWLRRLKADGKIRFSGFSFHDVPEAFFPILDDFAWDFCQIQLNYADWYQRGAEGMYNGLASRGIPIIAMEPVRGGGLTRLYPDMQAMLDALDPDVSPAAWALRFCAGLPHLDIVLSGMSTLEQCEENVKLMSDPPLLDQAGQEVLHRIASAFDRLPSIPCTNCRYCAGCPQKIDIPALFSSFNAYSLYQGSWPLQHIYRYEVPDERKASACTRCGACETACPQKIAVMDELARVQKVAESLWE